MNSAIQMCIRVERTLNADEFYSLAFWGFIFSLRSQPTHEIDDCLELVKRIRLSFCGSWAGEFKRWDVLAEPFVFRSIPCVCFGLWEIYLVYQSYPI